MNEKLLMTMSLIDQVTKPLQGISKEMHSAMDTGKSGLQDMATGGAGLVAAGFAIQNALMPAIEMDRKLGEVASLFAGPNEDLEETQRIMGSLQKEALSFSAAYGKSATDFVAASYDIQSAISGLQGNELAEFTKASGVLAAATKADTSTITNYMGTMYGIFQKDAAEMGNSEWVNRVAGMTAAAVQVFKTDGNKMSQAFSTLGSSATAMGVDMEEQMAILGSLQATMGGSEAATKYTAFLAGAVKAQDKLGLSFFDSQGKMLPMVDILQQLQGELGHLSTDAQFAALKDAFGSGEAVKLIQNLQKNTGGLADSIVQLNKQAKIETAEVMAAKMTDQWERLEASWFAIRAAAFGSILPAVNSVTGSIADGLVWLTSMTEQYPMLTEVISYAALGAVSLGGVVASLSLVMGIGKMMSAGWAVTMGTLNSVMKLLRIGTIAITASTWLFNAALWANPVTWVIAGIVALVAAVGAMIYWWDDLKASFADTAVFKMLSDTIDWVIDKLNMIPGINIEWRAGEMPQTPEADVAEKAVRDIPPLPDTQALEAQRQSVSIPEMKLAETQHQSVPVPDMGVVDAQSQSAPMPDMSGLESQSQNAPMPDMKALETQHQSVPTAELQTLEAQSQTVPMPDMQALEAQRQSASVLNLKELEAQSANIPQTQPVDMPNPATEMNTSVIDYKKPENAPKLNPNVVQNINSPQNRSTTMTRQFGDVYITQQGGFTPDELAEWDELNAG